MPSESSHDERASVADGVVALLVSGDPGASATLAAVTEAMGLAPVQAASGAEALEVFYDLRPRLVVIDYGLDDVPPLRLTGQLHTAVADVPIVALLGADDIQGGTEARRAGASGTITRPAQPDSLRRTLARLLEDARRRPSPWRTAPDPERLQFFKTYRSAFRRGPRTRELEQAVVRIAASDAPVLVRGESGAGKKLVARALHYLSARSTAPWARVACPALPPDVLEAELFGVEPGGPEGAGPAPGKLVLVNGGTLVLEEFTDLSLAAQDRIVQFLREGPSRLDVRIVATTSKEVERLVGVGALRDTLYYQLNVMPLAVPSLRDRREDIGALAEFFRTQFMELYRREAPRLSEALSSLLASYHWPGNVLELENLMKRYVVFGDEEQLTAELRVRSHIGGPRALGRRTAPNTESLREVGRRAAHEAEMAVILQTLERVHWNRAEAARLLRVSYKTLLNKLNRAGITGRSRTSELP